MGQENNDQHPASGAEHPGQDLHWLENAVAPATLIPTVMNNIGLAASEQLPPLQTIDQVIAALHDEREGVRVAALRACVALGERMPVEHVVAALDDASWNVRATAIETLGKTGERMPIGPVVAALRDEDAAVRVAVIAALGKLGERAPIEPLVAALRDPDWQVREMAALTLGELRERTPFKSLVTVASDEREDIQVREAAKMALRQHSETTTGDDEAVEIIDLDSDVEQHSYPARIPRIPFTASGSQERRNHSFIRRTAEGALSVALILAIGLSWFVLSRGLHRATTGGSVVPAITPITHKGTVLFTFHGRGGEGAAYPLWSSNGRYLSFVDTDGSVYVWDAVTRKLTKTTQLMQLAYSSAGTWESIPSPDGQYIFIGGYNGVVQILDAYTGRITLNYKNAAQRFPTFGWSADGSRVAVGSYDSTTVRIFDANTGKILLTFQGTLSRLSDLEWSPNGRYIASSSGGSMTGNIITYIQVWDTVTGRILATFPDHDLENVVWSPDNRHLLAVSDYRVHGDKSVRVWDALAGKELLTYAKNTISPYAEWSPDGSRILSASTSEILVWNAFTGRTILSLPFSFLAGGVGYFSWQLSPDGRRLAYVGMNNQVQIWDAVTGRELFVYRSPSLYVQSVAWSPDGTRLVSVGPLANAGEEAQIWNADTQSNVYTYNVAVSGSNLAAWSPDGKLLALPANDAIIQVLQVP